MDLANATRAGGTAEDEEVEEGRKEEDDEVPEFGSFWVQEVVADHGDEASDDRTDQEGDHEWKETRSVEAHDEANDDEDGTTEWSNHGHVFLKWEGSGNAGILASVIKLNLAFLSLCYLQG